MSRPGPQSAQFNQELGNMFFQAIEAAFTNPLNQLNRIGSGEPQPYNPDLTYEDVFQGAGLPAWAAGVLGLMSRVAEPSLPLPRAGRTGQATALTNPSTGARTTVYRSQTPTGRGAYTTDMPELAGSSPVRYATDSPQAAARHATSSTTVFEGGVAARPHGYLNVAGRAADADPVAMSRLRQMAEEMDPSGLLVRSVDEYRQGVIGGADLIKDIQRTLGSDFGSLPARAGIDVIGLPHNFSDPAFARIPGQEYIMFGNESWTPNNAWSFDEFLNLFRR